MGEIGPQGVGSCAPACSIACSIVCSGGCVVPIVGAVGASAVSTASGATTSFVQTS